MRSCNRVMRDSSISASTLPLRRWPAPVFPTCASVAMAYVPPSAKSAMLATPPAAGLGLGAVLPVTGLG